MPSNTAHREQHTDESPSPTLPGPVEELQNHSDVERVLEYGEDDSYDGYKVILDWVNESHVENGTRIITDAEYNGEIQTMYQFIESLDGIAATSGQKHGLEGYAIHVEPTRAM